MTDKQIIIDGLACVNCPEAKRCQEQQAKKEYAINQVLQDIPTEYTNVIARLKQIIPSVTRCDYVLEKQLKRKEEECERLKKQASCYSCGTCNSKEDYKNLEKHHLGLRKSFDQLHAENESLKKKLNPKLKNAHCAYFEGQTGLCKAKEFTKCNPVNCKLYTIDELSTIVNLQQQLDQLKKANDEKNEFLEKLGISSMGEFHRIKYFIDNLKAENDELKKNQRCAWKSLEGTFCPESLKQHEFLRTLNTVQNVEIQKLHQTLAEIREIAEKGHKEKGNLMRTWWFKDILQKISEVENEFHS